MSKSDIGLVGRYALFHLLKRDNSWDLKLFKVLDFQSNLVLLHAWRTDGDTPLVSLPALYEAELLLSLNKLPWEQRTIEVDEMRELGVSHFVQLFQVWKDAAEEVNVMNGLNRMKD